MFDATPTFFTDSVLIRSDVIPHSHPILTLNTNGLTSERPVSEIHARRIVCPLRDDKSVSTY
jgi:hypothetical protein